MKINHNIILAIVLGSLAILSFGLLCYYVGTQEGVNTITPQYMQGYEH